MRGGWRPTFLACLFRRKSRAIVIAKLLLLSSCNNFNVAHYSKSTIGINTKLGILAHHDKVQLQDKGHNSESCSFGVMPLVKRRRWEFPVSKGLFMPGGVRDFLGL